MRININTKNITLEPDNNLNEIAKNHSIQFIKVKKREITIQYLNTFSFLK